MKFGLFYELSVPRPWTRESERTVYDNALEHGHRPPHGQYVQLSGLPAHLGARGLSVQVLSLARAPSPAPPSGDGARGGRAGGGGARHGGPERVLRALKKWEAIRVDRVNFLLNTNETIPQADVLASLRLFAREVMPAFSDTKAEAGAPGNGGRH